MERMTFISPKENDDLREMLSSAHKEIDESYYDAIAMAETAHIEITPEQAIEFSELSKKYGEYAPISDPLILYSLLNDEQRFLLTKTYKVEL